MKRVSREVLLQTINECLDECLVNRDAREMLFLAAHQFLTLYGHKWVRRTSHYIPDYDELLSETMYLATLYFDQFDNFNAWAFLSWLTRLARTANGLELKGLQHHRRATAEVAMTRPLACSDYPPDSELEAAESREKRAKSLRSALGTLPSELSEMLVLKYLEGNSIFELASKYRMPVNTIKTKLARGRTRLHVALTRMGLDRDELFG